MIEPSIFGAEWTDPKVVVEEVRTTRATVVSRLGGAREFRESLEAISVLIVPADGHAGYESPVFPRGSMEVLRFLREHLPGELTTDIAAEDENYEELTLHAAMLVLPAISVLGKISGTVVLGILSNYIFDVIKTDSARRATRVRAKVLVHENDKTVAITYDGPAHSFEELTKSACQSSAFPATEVRADRVPNINIAEKSTDSRTPRKEGSEKQRRKKGGK